MERITIQTDFVTVQAYMEFLKQPETLADPKLSQIKLVSADFSETAPDLLDAILEAPDAESFYHLGIHTAQLLALRYWRDKLEESKRQSAFVSKKGKNKNKKA